MHCSLLFIIYIKDVVNSISLGSKISLFVDNSALYRVIIILCSPDDYLKLEADVDATVKDCLLIGKVP